MREFRPINDKDEVCAYYKKAGLDMSIFSQCLKATDKNEVLGFCLYDLTHKDITVRYIEPIDNLALGDGILRSTLHVAAEKSIMNAFYGETVPEEFFKKLGFIKNSDEKSLDIDKLFKSCADCAK